MTKEMSTEIKSVTMIRATVRPEYVGEVEASLRIMFAALQQRALPGVQYASCRAPDGVTFVILLSLEQPLANPLPGVPEFLAFQAGLKTWLAGPPVAEQLTVVGSHRLF